MKTVNLIFIVFFIHNIFNREILIDPGCDEDYPARCPDIINSDQIICKSEYQECQPFQGCQDTLYPYLCSNGTCAKNQNSCQFKYQECEQSKLSRCQDGLCRHDCQIIQTSACPLKNPLRCPDGRCVLTEIQCTSINCPSNRPYMCVDGDCKTNFQECHYPQNGKIIQDFNTYSFTNDQTFYIRDQENKLIFKLFVKLHHYVNIKGIGLSRIQNSKLKYDQQYDNVFLQFFKNSGDQVQPRQFIRSAIFDLGLFGKSKSTNFPAVIHIQIDFIFSFNKIMDKHRIKELYCLAQLINNEWVCKFWNISSQSRLLTYKVDSDGIYAVVFNPTMKINQKVRKELFCGMLCNHRKIFTIDCISYIFCLYSL